MIEETDNPNEREKYWINYYNSFNDGIKHYLMNGDFLSIEQANPQLNIDKIKSLAIIIPCLKDLEYSLSLPSYV